jgi:hypothetical protein
MTVGAVMLINLAVSDPSAGLCLRGLGMCGRGEAVVPLFN